MRYLDFPSAGVCLPELSGVLSLETRVDVVLEPYACSNPSDCSLTASSIFKGIDIPILKNTIAVPPHTRLWKIFQVSAKLGDVERGEALRKNI